MTYNRSVDVIRKRKILPIAEVPTRAVEPSKKNDLSDASMAAFAKLKPQERALLHRRIVEDYSYDELAEQMDVPASTLRKRYERAKQKFAVAYEEMIK